ncbi:ift46 [Acrasis kona]|uniref:Ift46 n=1 Tax=Acrasis kona TaxID=1008807 RepID=A0AAW2Z2I0_9EUKA
MIIDQTLYKNHNEYYGCIIKTLNQLRLLLADDDNFSSGEEDDDEFNVNYDRANRTNDDDDFAPDDDTDPHSVMSSMNSDTMPSRTQPQQTTLNNSRHNSANNRQTISTHSRNNSASYTNTSNQDNAQKVNNRPFDEVMDVLEDSDAESIPSPDNSPQHKSMSMSVAQKGTSQNNLMQSRNFQARGMEDNQSEGESEESGDERSDTDTDTDEGQATLYYDPNNFSNLPVAPEVKELFAFILAYKTQDVELDTKLKPFIPEYMPAVGELDAFLKVPRPDNKEDNLGLKVLDEPAAKQSDPAVIQLNMSYMSRDLKTKPVVVKSIENAEKNPKKIQKWIDDIRDLHRTKPPPSVHYSKPMPDLEVLSQPWPEQFEEVLNSIELPGAEIDVDLESYIRIICSVLDIPVYTNIIESLHLLFTLYLDFKQNTHFNQQMEGNVVPRY